HFSIGSLYWLRMPICQPYRFQFTTWLPTVLHVLHTGYDIKPCCHHSVTVVIVMVGKLLRLPEVRLLAVVLLVHTRDDRHQAQVGLAVALLEECHGLLLCNFASYGACNTRST